jgi:hypothetical protein
MQKVYLLWFCMLTALASQAQSSFIRRNMDDSYLLERFDILRGRVSDSLHTALNPITRKDAVEFLEQYRIDHASSLSQSDKEDIAEFIAKNSEWASNGDGSQESINPIFNTFYKKKSDLIHYNKGGNSFILNPIIYYQQMAEQGNTGQNLFFNSRGLEARGTLLNKVSFYTNFTDNQERGPLHHQNYVLRNSAVPGANFYKVFKPEKAGVANDYLLATGYVDAELLKNTINVTFGHDKFHLGDGYRSLFLSDFGSNYLFLKLNTRVWKLNYQNLFMELTPQYARNSDRLLPKKYAAMHHLSINATKWLNIGLFESIIFGRQDHFDFQYMNPIIFYRSIEQMNGSPDNALLGINFKINPGIKAIVYGQVMLDEFKLSELKAGNGWWANKYAFQLGVKATDLFKVKDLFAQVEINMVRPFMYSRDSVSNYSHYNQPLAHPFGANFLEANVQLRYKPMQKLYLTLKAFYNKQGRDSLSNVAFGSDIFDSYKNRNSEYGIRLFNGFASEVLFGNLNASYELKQNLYIDLGGNYRYEKATHPSNPTWKSMQVYLGFRLNAIRKQYDY